MGKNRVTKLMREERNYHKLTAAEQGLFHELVWIASGYGTWKEEFTCSNIILCRRLNISENTLRKFRNRLIEAELISYESRQKSKEPGIYKWTTRTCSKYTANSTAKSTVKNDDNNIIYNIIYINNIEINIREKFTEFHQRYPGTKRKADTELLHFANLYPTEYEELTPLLLSAIEKLIVWRRRRINLDLFVPTLSTLKSWISQRQWENELERIELYD